MTSVTLPVGTGLLQLPSEFPLEHGGVLDAAQLAFELEGPDDAPVVCVLGGISADRHVTATASDPRPGWWQPFVGTACAVDTRRFRVLGFDYLGGVGASTGPADGESVPVVAPIDQARALAVLLDHLGIGELHAVIGASYGGMVGLAFAATFPARAQRLVAISAPAASHPLATAWRSLQRDVVRLGVRCGASTEALALARGFAMTSYRSADEFADRFAGLPDVAGGVVRFPVDGYLQNRGVAFTGLVSPERFLCLSQSLDLHTVEPSAVRTPTTIVAVPSDRLVPFSQLEELAHALPGVARFHAVASRYGHDAFLKEVGPIGAIVRATLARTEVVR